MENSSKRIDINDLHDVITMEELSQLLGVSLRLISDMSNAGEIKSFKVGSRRLYLKQDILEMIGYDATKVEQKEEVETKEPIQKEQEPEKPKDGPSPFQPKQEQGQVLVKPVMSRHRSYQQMDFGL